MLVESILQNQSEDYRLAYPALFLYRHSLELLLKEVIGSRSPQHDLRTLTAAFEEVVQERFNQPVPSWFKDRMMELAAIDPGSTAFRYGENYDKASKSFGPVPGEVHADLRYLRAVMETMNRALRRVIAKSE